MNIIADPQVIRVLTQGPVGPAGPTGPAGPIGGAANDPTQWFASVTQAAATTLDPAVNRVVIFGGGTDPDLFSQYHRSGVASGDFQSADGAWWVIDKGVVGALKKSMTITVGPSGAMFAQPGDAAEWLSRHRIFPGVTITVAIADGTYTCTKTIRGHDDGQRIKWTNGGLNGAPLTGADFAFLDSTWVIDPATGFDPASMDAGRALAEPVVRAKYKVILQWAGGEVKAAVACSNKHSGDWSGAPTLFINTGDAQNGVITGTAVDSGVGDGPGGVGVFPGSCFFNFGNANICADYGGIINVAGALLLFSPHVCARADFTGGFYGAGVVVIGGKDYGYRANHGGFCYWDAPYMHGNSIAIEVTNSPGMARVHNCDIQYNYIGISVSWGGSAKAFQGIVKNNARSQMTTSSEGAIDARQAHLESTALFGSPAVLPTFGIYLNLSGSCDAASATITGHGTDIRVDGLTVVRLFGATFGVAKADGAISGPDSLGYLRAAATGRPQYAEITLSGSTLTLPAPCPQSLGIVSATPGAPITIDTIDVTNMPYGQSINIVAANANAGETITFIDSTELSLAAPKRYLSHVRDVLTLLRPYNSGMIAEQAYKRNFNNCSADQKRVRVHTTSTPVAVTIDDDIVVVNKATGSASPVSLAATLNWSGREIGIKDGKGDAAANPITITPAAGTIDGAASLVINTNFGRARLVYNGTQWNVL